MLPILKTTLLILSTWTCSFLLIFVSFEDTSPQKHNGWFTITAHLPVLRECSKVSKRKAEGFGGHVSQNNRDVNVGLSLCSLDISLPVWTLDRPCSWVVVNQVTVTFITILNIAHIPSPGKDDYSSETALSRPMSKTGMSPITWLDLYSCQPY